MNFQSLIDLVRVIEESVPSGASRARCLSTVRIWEQLMMLCLESPPSPAGTSTQTGMAAFFVVIGVRSSFLVFWQLGQGRVAWKKRLRVLLLGRFGGDCDDTSYGEALQPQEKA